MNGRQVHSPHLHLHRFPSRLPSSGSLPGYLQRAILRPIPSCEGLPFPWHFRSLLLISKRDLLHWMAGLKQLDMFDAFVQVYNMSTVLTRFTLQLQLLQPPHPVVQLQPAE